MSATTIYDLLTGIKLDNVTTSQLDTAGGRAYVDQDSIAFWQGILTLSHVMKATRTYAHGLPIPEESVVSGAAIDDGASQDLQPTGTEVWLVENITADSCDLFLSDGSSDTAVTLGTSNLTPLYLTNGCFLRLRNGSGSSRTPSWAYHKVSL